MRRIPDIAWAKYKKITQDFLENDAGLKPIQWLSYIDQPSQFGEGENGSHISTELMVLINYNVYRTWPINTSTTSGEIDRETLTIIISKRYLEELALLDKEGYFTFDIVRDRFIIDGKVYISSGDTSSSQAGPNDLISMVILKRVDNESPGSFKIYKPAPIK